MEFIYNAIVVSENGKSNYCVIYRIYRLLDYADYDMDKIKASIWKPELQSFLYVGFFSNAESEQHKGTGDKQTHHINLNSKHRSESENDMHDLLLFNINSENYHAKYLFNGNKKLSPICPECWDVLFRNYDEVIPKIITKYKKVSSKGKGFTIEEPRFNMVRQDFLTVEKWKTKKDYNILCNQISELYDRNNGEMGVWNTYPFLQEIVYNWIDGRLSVDDINKLNTREFYGHCVEDKEVKHSWSTVIYNPYDFRILKCSHKLYDDMSAFYFDKIENNFLHRKVWENWNNVCVLTNDSVGQWIKNRIDGKTTEVVEKDMSFFVTQDSFDLDNDMFLLTILYRKGIDKKILKFPLHRKKAYIFSRKTPVPLIPVSYALFRRYMETGFIAGYPERIIEEFLKKYAKEKTFVKKFRGIKEYKVEYDDDYTVSNIITKYYR